MSNQELARFFCVLLGVAVFAGLFSKAACWVHTEYYKRHAEGRAPAWLYHLECARYFIGRDYVSGRPETPLPNDKKD